MRAEAVKEMQGLYGPFTLTERVLQKVWLRQDFDVSVLRTTCGKIVEVKDPGRWNLLGGPDFKEAHLTLDGQELVGDLEVHFSPYDWYVHAHEKNPEYNSVVLHVVLTDVSGAAQSVKTQAGKELLTVVLMPLLEQDLESYAMDDALHDMEKVDELEWVAKFFEKPIDVRIDALREQAEFRWEHKLKYAKQRLAEADWSTCCHHYCMEVLGYSGNRAPMSHLAHRYSSEQLSSGVYSADTLYAELAGQWKLSGLRPANHPRKRLQQYLTLLQKKPDWPEQLRMRIQRLSPFDSAIATSSARQLAVFPDKIEDFRRDSIGDEIGLTRFHTMMIDAFLPLAAAAGEKAVSSYWWHWWAGDCPDAVKRFLKHTQLTHSSQPISNGLVQGAIGLFLNRGE